MEPGHRTAHRLEFLRAPAAHPSLQRLRRSGGRSLCRDEFAEIFLMQPLLRVLKPVVFLACLFPALRLCAGVLNAFGFLHAEAFSLGADPVKVMLHTCGRWTLNFLL